MILGGPFPLTSRIPAHPPNPTGSGVNTSRVLLIAGLVGAVGFLSLFVARGWFVSRGKTDHVTGAARFLRGFIAGDSERTRRPTAGGPLTRPVDPRVLILKSERKLYLLDGPRVVGEWDVQLGFEPDGPKTREGDGRTPEGTFFVCTRNSLSRFHRFLGLSYPSIPDADRGLREGALAPAQADAIRRAITGRVQPPWNTPLGGAVGIHGTGGPTVPGDWTAGCIALPDAAIDRLFRILEVGDPVEIRP